MPAKASKSPKASKAPSKGLFRLKAGTHSSGNYIDKNFVMIRASDPNPIVESDIDLVADDPLRWEYYRGLLPARQPGTGALDLPPAYNPSPPEQPKTAEQMKEEAKQLMEQAKQMEEQAELQAKTEKQQAKQLKTQQDQRLKQMGLKEEDDEETDDPAAQTDEDAEDAEASAQTEDEGEDDLDSKTVAELYELADDEEIDLQGAKRKPDIVARIREAREEE